MKKKILTAAIFSTLSAFGADETKSQEESISPSAIIKESADEDSDLEQYARCLETIQGIFDFFGIN